MRFDQTNCNKGNVNNAVSEEADVAQAIGPGGSSDVAIREPKIVAQGEQRWNRVNLWVGIAVWCWWLGMALLWLGLVLQRTE
jgi:hypothetical protein